MTDDQRKICTTCGREIAFYGRECLCFEPVEMGALLRAMQEMHSMASDCEWTVLRDKIIDNRY